LGLNIGFVDSVLFVGLRRVCVVKGRVISINRKASESPDAEERLSRLMVGQSPAMSEVMTMIRQVAQYPTTTVLLQGESGTGKDVVAHAIHALSSRSTYPFVDINCAAIPETLLETELFGVEAGAYTDAKASREGYLLRADGGTLFLDEVGSMPLVLQAKLLRFLETRSFRRVGSTKEMHVDLRVISATNVDLEAAVASRAFRDDLFYRLKVITIYLPPLRERLEDIEPLVDYFIQSYNNGSEIPLRIHPDAIALLRRYHWPGNVRELRSVIQRGQILCEDGEIRPEDLPESVRYVEKSDQQRLRELQAQMHLPIEGLDLRAYLAGIEQIFVREALERYQGNQVRAAALLRLSRDQLRYRLPKGADRRY
jgi:two-component system response regulator AtoC